MKKFFKNIAQNWKNVVWPNIKLFFSKWNNICFVICLLCGIVFLSLFTVAKWCSTVGIGFLTLALGFLSYTFTLRYFVFTKLINMQKKEILNGLAQTYQREEYLSLKTPFKEEEESYIQTKIKEYKSACLILWTITAILLITFIFVVF